MASNVLSQHARQVMNVIGDRSQWQVAGRDPSIARSWERCLRDYHLDPAQSHAPTVLEQTRILEDRERLQQVLRIADPEMSNLHRQLSGAGHAVLLTNARGIILNCITHQAERPVFEQAGLWLGADWSEEREGTNGIGTCLVERQALTIHRDEHFRGRHIGLTCSASPVFDPMGELLAVLDVSSARPQMTRQSQFHTMTLVNLAAKQIEGNYFLAQYRHLWLLRLQLPGQLDGLYSDGLLALEEDGRVRAVNQGALNLLGQERQVLLGQSVEQLFDCRLSDLMGRASMLTTPNWSLRTRDGRQFQASIQGEGRRPQIAVPALKPVEMPKSSICLADARLQRDFQRALRVYERDVPLLLIGETGSGKEAFARAVHLGSSRRDQPFVALNCASIPESLIESELFGYRGGTFTGARKEGMRGKLQQADGGTLLLDEIGDMPLGLQTRLLRVLEERQVVPLGGEPQSIDVRIISATHRQLDEKVGEGTFREDLFYRLAGLEVDLPPLRERADKAELLQTLLEEESAGQHAALDPAAREILLGYAWPGNVRQLRNVLRTLVALCEDGRITVADLPALIRRMPVHGVAASPNECASPLDDAEREALIGVLEQQRWHMTQVAQQLGISRNTLYRKLRKHGISRQA